MMMLLLWFLDMGLLTVAGRLLRVVCCVSFNLCRALMVVRVFFFVRCCWWWRWPLWWW